MKHIVCFHLFNDYSGSPKVLRMVLEGMLKKEYRVELVSSKGGVLDELLHYPNLRKHSYPYRFSSNGAVTMLRYGLVQIYTFFLSFRWLFCKDAVFYINTLLPVGPALAGRLMGKRVVYHYHENAFVKGAFYKMLAAMMERLAHSIICVSEYQASFLKCREKVTVVPNALPEAFVKRLKPDPEAAFGRKTVLMLGSLKEYKGTKEFIELSQRMSQYRFVLVINDTQENIDKYLKDNNLEKMGGGNLTIYARQSDVFTFYNTSSIVLTLTNPKLAIETFGLTTLEAMANALPVIVPIKGGIAELVEDGVNGFKTDVNDMELIEKQISMLFGAKEYYIKMAKKAWSYSKAYDAGQMRMQIEMILNLK